MTVKSGHPGGRQRCCVNLCHHSKFYIMNDQKSMAFVNLSAKSELLSTIATILRCSDGNRVSFCKASFQRIPLLSCLPYLKKGTVRFKAPCNLDETCFPLFLPLSSKSIEAAPVKHTTSPAGLFLFKAHRR